MGPLLIVLLCFTTGLFLCLWLVEWQRAGECYDHWQWWEIEAKKLNRQLKYMQPGTGD